MANAQDLKSCDPKGLVGSSPTPGTRFVNGTRMESAAYDEKEHAFGGRMADPPQAGAESHPWHQLVNWAVGAVG